MCASSTFRTQRLPTEKPGADAKPYTPHARKNREKQLREEREPLSVAQEGALILNILNILNTPRNYNCSKSSSASVNHLRGRESLYMVSVVVLSIEVERAARKCGVDTRQKRTLRAPSR
jgi:hypothetical protein